MSATSTAPSGAFRPSRLADYARPWRTQLPLVGGFLFLLAVAAASVWLMLDSHNYNAHVAHTLQVRSTAYRLLAMIQDAETGERGFLLTGNPDYLKPYETGRAEGPKVLRALRTLVAASEVQSATMGILAAAISAKLDDLALTISLKRQDKDTELLAHVNLNTGNDLMQQIRVQIGRIESEEIHRQSMQSAAVESANELLGGASLLGILAVFSLAGYSIYSSSRATRALLKAQVDLRHTNENLEGIVAERVSELQIANEEIQRFAYIVSHDLRAPLVNVMGFTSELDAARLDIMDFMKGVEAKAPDLLTADSRTAIETDLPEALTFIRTSTAKMDRLINAILKLSREGRRVLTPQPIDVAALIEAQRESLMQQLDAADAELTVRSDLPTLITDRLAVEQIFGNLIENAVKYLSPDRPGRIVVSGKSQGAYRRYDIADNGRGIEPKDFERVFELFRRSGEQDKPGEGIGLAYVRNLARRLGGNVTVQSEFGKGSTFTVVLPAAYTAPNAHPARARNK